MGHEGFALVARVHESEGRVPPIEAFRRFIPEKYGMQVVVGTHPIPQKYFLTHDHCGTWQGAEWKPLLEATLTDEATRLGYD
jgi:hypothetical protein